MKYLKFFCCLTIVITSASAANFSSKEGGRVIHMTGPIVEGDGTRFLQLVTPQTKIIQVQSGGGETDEAMLLGRLIHDRRLDLEVDEFCASSCAIYLFPAAIRKTIPKASMLGLHGTAQLTASAPREEIKKKLSMAGIADNKMDAELPGFLKAFEKQALMERAYARYLGINMSFYTDYRRVINGSSVIEKKFSGDSLDPLWWPNPARFEHCYGIRNVTDLSRPAELETIGYKIIPKQPFIFLGDIGLRKCLKH